MKNTKTTVIHRLTAIALVAVMVFSMGACDHFGQKPETDTDNPDPFYAVDVSTISDWDRMLVRKDGARIFFNINENTGKPTRMFFQPKKDLDDGLSMTCKENGLPEIMEAGGYLFYFGNFNGYTFDLAVIPPVGETEYHYGVETDIDFDSIDGRNARAMSGSRSAWDPTTWDLYDWGSLLLTVGSCFAGVFAPVPFAGLCIGGAISFGVGVTADLAIDVLVSLDVISEEAGMAASATVSVVVDGLGCVKLDPFECVQTATGLAHTLFSTAMDYGDLANEKKLELLREGIKEIENKPLVFWTVETNGSSQSATTKLIFKFDEDIPGLHAGNISLQRSGHTGISKGGLTSKGGGVYELEVSGVTRSGTIEVKVGVSGYDTVPYIKQIYVSAPSKPISFISVTADGSEATDGSPGVKTTKLILTFNTDIEGYPIITLDAGITGAERHSFNKIGTGVYELGLWYVTQTGPVTVKVSIDDYFFPTGVDSHTVTVYALPGALAPTDHFTLLTPKAITPTATFYLVSRIAYGGGRFFASVNIDNYNDWYRVAQTTDGLNWLVSSSNPLGGSYGGFVLAYGSGKFLAGGYSKIVQYTDSTGWANVNHPFGGNYNYRAIAYGGGRFVVGGDSGKMAWSTDGGENWTVVTNSPMTSIINAIAYGSDGNAVSRFVVGGGNGKIAWSTDGENWTAVTDSTFKTDFGYIYAIAYGGGKFVAVGYDGPNDTNGKMAYSPDGMNWTTVANNTFGNSPIIAIAYGNGKFVAGGASGKMATSPDGVTWTAVTNSPFGTTGIRAITYGDGMFIAGGEGGKMAWSK